MLITLLRVALCFAQLEAAPSPQPPQRQTLRPPKPSHRPEGTSVIRVGVAYEPNDDDCADSCDSVPDRYYDDCREACEEQR